jgi:periplasmic protein TonB
MGYQALLFCPEEKTARTVTQVLSELEFSVNSCNEPFAAVKKLMAEHFDAVVVDCDNEQNATLLFKSARNSTSNQTSLAVAVVEGQAGVAKAFRIGANLVLTKPINVEQAKGTLRVARGLLRKGDPAKPATVLPSAAPAPTKTTTAVPASKLASPAATPAIPHLIVSASIARSAMPAEKPVQAASPWTPAAAPVAQTPHPNESDVLDIDAEAAVAASPIPAAPPSFKSTPPQPFPKTSSPTAGVNPLLSAPTGGVTSTTAGTGAASAAAPARIVPQQPASPVGESSVAANTPHTGHVVAQVSGSPAPTFTFGGANAPESPAGGSKKALIGVAAAMVVSVGLYFGWTQFHGKSASTSPSPSTAVPQPAPASNTASPSVQPSKPQPFSTSRESAATPVSSPSTHSATPSKPSVEKPEPDVNTDDSEPTPAKNLASAKNSSKGASTESSSPAKSAPESRPVPQPIMVKNGATAPVHARPAPATDAPALSALDIAPTASGGGLPNLVTHQDGPQPVLQALNISQGVSQGLLIKKVSPVYPPSALRMHVEGSVQLMATIGKSGSISAVKVVSGESVLSKAALDAVKQWKYKPYYLNGEPVEIQTQITVNFKLPK